MKFIPDTSDLRNFGRNGLALLLASLLIAATAAQGANVSAYALVEKGNAAYQAGRYDEALKHYNEASVANPESAELYFNRGTVHYQKGDYEAASKAFADAAVRGKEPALEANARYNQGNCSFREAERQRDSDLNKAIEACREAIGHYQRTLELNPAMKQAAENIEIVRLYVKALLDEQQKKQEEQQQQDDLGKKLKELLERQIEEIKGSDTLSKAQPAVEAPQAAEPIAPPAPAENGDPLASTQPQLGESAPSQAHQSGSFDTTNAPQPAATLAPQVASAASEDWAKSVADHAGSQKTLQDDTSAVLEGMRQMEAQMQQQAAAPPQPGQPSPAPASPDQNEMVAKLGQAIGHVDESVKAQGAAVQQFSTVTASKTAQEQQQSAASFASARQQQQQSAQHLAEALQALSDPKQDDQQQQQDQNKDGDQKDGDQKQDEKNQQGDENKDDQQEKKDGGENDDQKKDGDEQEPRQNKDGKEGEQGDEEKEQQQQSALKPVKDSAEDILNEEKENQKRRVPVRMGGVRPVEKDW
ncbi:MAG: tetratricopeptide repeat protein [Verrucomicrobiae bacterium]|nr:tetratricopeptide repeat protein [Verrucomicrobiae bacterium]